MILSNELKNNILYEVANNIRKDKKYILEANRKDLESFDGQDKAMYDRLKVDDVKILAMVHALESVAQKKDPIGIVIDDYRHPNGLKVVNKTSPFGTILIIYESRPDVTIEAAAIAFKTGNKILLKGGKEALQSNLALVDCWHRAFEKYQVDDSWVKYLNLPRAETQAFLKNPTEKVDLIVPRGGEQLISFVKEHANCPVLVSGRGNNFLYVDSKADMSKAVPIILNGKLSKISACNALDKVLVDRSLPNFESIVKDLAMELKSKGVEVLYGEGLDFEKKSFETDTIWYEEFLDYKIVIGGVNGLSSAVKYINEYSGGHSASIITESHDRAQIFMENVDCAAVYHNSSTRFTDGGEFGMGAELAISTEKIHHRGPLGLSQLVTNKYYVFGEGQIRE